MAPKRARLDEAQRALELKQTSLREAQERLEDINRHVEELKATYNERIAHKERLKVQAEETELKLARAAALVEGLGGNRERWIEMVKTLEERIGFLPGDCMLAAAFIAYAGPFPAEYRTRLVVDTLIADIRRHSVPVDPRFDFSTFLADAAVVRQWRIDGLPSDAFSCENGLLVTTTRHKWPLLVDPAGQAVRWVRNMERDRNITLVNVKNSDYLKVLENAIQYGLPILLQGSTSLCSLFHSSFFLSSHIAFVAFVFLLSLYLSSSFCLSLSLDHVDFLFFSPSFLSLTHSLFPCCA